jgi:DNA-binding LacI/PurR family transcriptional regulator
MTGDTRPRRVTGADVAREAGVSATTVSYVLNNTPHQKIPAGTRQRILEAAARLGYTPSAAARALSNGRSEVVLCLLPDWPIGPALGLLLEHLTDALADKGFTLLAYPHARAPRPTSELWKAITPAAVVGFAEFDDLQMAAMRGAGIDVVLTMLGRVRGRQGLGIPTERIGRLQVEHLAATGHRHLGYAFPQDERLSGLATVRLDGVRRAVADLGLSEPVVTKVSLDPAAAANVVVALRAQTPPVTGVCAFNDYTALALVAGMHDLGLTPPEDLAVIGVDDIPAAAVGIPPLTTVATDQEAVGQHLAATVVAALAGKPAPRRPGSDIVQLIRRATA